MASVLLSTSIYIGANQLLGKADTIDNTQVNNSLVTRTDDKVEKDNATTASVQKVQTNSSSSQNNNAPEHQYA